MRPMLFFFLVFLSAFVTAQRAKKDGRSVEVLKQLLAKLSSYETMSYNYYRGLHYFSENYHRETDGTIFLDFRSNDTAFGFTYQAENKSFKSVYNGSESFYIDKDEKTIKVSFKVQFEHFESLPGFSNSIITLKNALPEIINSDEVIKSVADTMIDAKDYHVASFTLQNKTLNNSGVYFPVSLKRDFFYKIIIDKTTFLPIQVIQTNSAEPKDYIVTAFSNLHADISQLPESSWYYSTYKSDYKTTDKKAALINTNTSAPDWEGAYFNSAETVALSKLKGRIVLLEFWIKNCGYCIAAVPELNSLNKKYKNSKLSVIGINRYDKQEDVHFFYEKNRPNFKTVLDKDGRIATSYGIDGFPTIVVIDKTGKVLYAGGFDLKLLDGLLKTALLE